MHRALHGLSRRVRSPSPSPEPSKSSPSPLGPAPESIIKVGVVLMRICAWPGYLWVAVHAEVARTSCKQQQLQLRHRRMPLDIPRVGHLWSAGVKIKNNEWNARLVIFGIWSRPFRVNYCFFPYRFCLCKKSEYTYIYIYISIIILYF